MTRSLVLAALVACTPSTDTDDTGATGTPTDSGATTDTDSVPHTDTDPTVPTVPEGLYFDADHVLVMPDGEGLKLVANDGSVTSATWLELIGCTSCGGEGATADDDGGLILSFTLGGGPGTGGIAHLYGGTGALDFRRDGFGFPHGACRDPSDQTIIVQETSGNKLTWIAGDGSSAAPLRTLTNANGDWPGNTPNGLYRFGYGGKTYLLSTHRGGFGGAGEITMWDISATPPSFVWRFPEDGAGLDTPHGPRMRWYDGQWWLLWAHTEGAQGGGSIGIASAADPLQRPTYVADLLVPSALAPLDFVRGVELTTDGTLIVTDSGGLGGGQIGRLIVGPIPEGLAPTGASGDVGVDQQFVELAEATVWLDGLDNPFEGWLWEPTFSL